MTPAWCALSILFSDWDRSGRRDLRISNDRHYYSDLSDGQEQLWRIAPGEAPRRYGPDDGWRLVRIQGMGIASHDLTGDGYPEVYLTSQGPKHAPGADRRAVQAGTTRDIALERGVDGDHDRTPAAIACPRRPGTPNSRTSTTTASSTCSSRRATSSAQPDYAVKDPSNLLLGQPDGTFAQAPRPPAS